MTSINVAGSIVFLHRLCFEALDFLSDCQPKCSDQMKPPLTLCHDMSWRLHGFTLEPQYFQKLSWPCFPIQVNSCFAIRELKKKKTRAMNLMTTHPTLHLFAINGWRKLSKGWGAQAVERCRLFGVCWNKDLDFLEMTQDPQLMLFLCCGVSPFQCARSMSPLQEEWIASWPKTSDSINKCTSRKHTQFIITCISVYNYSISWSLYIIY